MLRERVIAVGLVVITGVPLSFATCFWPLAT